MTNNDQKTIKQTATEQTIIPLEYINKNWYHFSVDDVFDSLIEITRNEMPVFSHSFFKILKEMHDQYGTNVDLELFWCRNIDGILYTLKDIRDIRNEIAKSGSWLRFAPHAHSYQIAPFEQNANDLKRLFDSIYIEIDRFAGNNTYAHWVRLHFYSEMYELAEYFKNKGVVALFSTHREVGSHRMPEHIAKSLNQTGFAKYQNMNFIRTQFRVEDLTNGRASNEKITELLQNALNKYGHITFYTHEYELARSEAREVLRCIFKELHDLNLVPLLQ